MARLLALVLCALFYAAGLAFLFRSGDEWAAPVTTPRSIRMNFVQMELAAAAQPEEIEPEPAPEPEPEPEPEVMSEPEEADVAPDEVPERSRPEPEPVVETVPERTVAQVTQEAASPVAVEDPDLVTGWVVEQLEKEKYFPPAAERFGLSGTFGILFVIDGSGTILSAEVQDGRGHRILRQALQKMLSRIRGRSYGRPIGEPFELEIRFEFE